MNRRRSRGHAPKGKYAQIPVDVSKAVLAQLSAPEFRVWFSLCLQCQHWSNGTGKLCRSVIREFHLGSQRVVTAATRKLLESGYIVRTRKAKQRTCALYGVTHLPLNYDAMEKAGVLQPLSDSNRGSASSDSTAVAPTIRFDNTGSASVPHSGLALPQGNRMDAVWTPLALPQGNTSKNLPSASGKSTG